MIVLSLLCAVLGAASNATGTALQRKAAAQVPGGDEKRLLAGLVRQATWWGGIAGVCGAALFQALALLNGPLALVQPVFILELPFALLIGLPLLHRQLPEAGWVAIGAVVFGLVLVLACAAPSGAADQSTLARWVPALIGCVGAMCVAVVLAHRRRNGLFRAAALGTGAAIGNALTAALLKSASGIFSDDGFHAFLTSWQTYGFALTGIAAVLLLENALQAGSLAASQPALTIGDATVSLLLGIVLFDEKIRTGWWVVPELAGIAVIVTGVIALTRAVPHIRDVAG